MGRRAKQAGGRWEHDAAKDLSQSSGKWKKIPGSGALGTLAGEPLLEADLVGSYPWFSRNFRAEAKYGYGGDKQLTLKREWIQGIRDICERLTANACLLLKFRDVKYGDRESAKLICFNFDTWNRMMADIESLWADHLRLLEKEYNEQSSRNSKSSDGI